MTQLTTQRLILRRLTAEDAPWIAQEIAHPEVHVRLINPPYPYHLQDARDWLADEDTADGAFAICENDRPHGVISYPTATHDDELGFWLRRDAWGRGIMTEAARAVIDWHFDRTDTPMRSGYVIDNAASAKVQTKLGFQPTKTTRLRRNFRGETVDIQRTRLDAKVWAAKRA